MAASEFHHRKSVANAIRHLASSPETRRYAAALPQFAVEQELPTDMAAKVEKLKKAQKRRR